MAVSLGVQPILNGLTIPNRSNQRNKKRQAVRLVFFYVFASRYYKAIAPSIKTVALLFNTSIKPELIS